MTLHADNAEAESLWYGTASLTPDRPITAGDTGSWTITYTVGRYGVDNGGRIKVAMRLASDWATPQMHAPGEADYFAVCTTGEASVDAICEHKGYLRPWFRVVTISVSNGSLKKGDQVIMTYGDTEAGGPGTRAQTFSESQFEFRVLVESFETGVFVRVPTSPTVRITGGDAHRLVVIGPSQVVAGEPFSLTVKAEDAWGNPSSTYAGSVHFEKQQGLHGLPEILIFSPSERGVKKVDGIRLTQPGTHRIRACDPETGMRAVGNPILCLTQERLLNLYWADLHGQTESTVGTGSVQEYFTFAREVSCVDVCTHQGNDFQITQEDWREICDWTRKSHQPGKFITYLGYEWSGNTPAGGDHNVLWFEDDQPIYRSSHWQISDRSDADLDRYPISELYETLRHEKALIIPHIGGRRATLDYHDPELEPLIEICSVHGRFEWFLQEALNRGCRVGVVGAGDDHTGRPGASYGTDSSFGVRGGLAGILARELTREGIWEALRARRTYATTGERIILSVQSEGHHMGEEFTTNRPPSIDVHVAGTQPLHSVQIIRGCTVVYDHPLVLPDSHAKTRIRLAWSGARITGRGRHTNWDGSLGVEGARFAEVTEFAFDNPRQGVTGFSEAKICWHSHTSGDLDGLFIDVDGDGGTFTFDTEPLRFRFTLDDLKHGALVRDAGGVQQQVEVSLARCVPGPEEVRLTFIDSEALPGLNPYYVRVMQEDGEMAWSSPLYIHHQPQ